MHCLDGRSLLIPGFVLVFGCGLTALAAAPAAAGVFTPTKTADTRDGACTEADCSLREAVIAANESSGHDVIRLPAGTYSLTLEGAGEDAAATGDLDILGDLTVLGHGVDTTFLDGESLDRVVHVLAGARVDIRDLTVTSGRAAGGAGGDADGGGVLSSGALTLVRTAVIINDAGGAGGGVRSRGTSAELAVRDSLIAGNRAGTVGGGIAAQGAMDLGNVTLSQNTAGQLGGGLHAQAGLDGRINNATIHRNGAQQGGGVFAESAGSTGAGRPRFLNSILAGNFATAEPDCSGAAASGGYNLLGVGGGCVDFQAAKGDKTGTAAAPLDPRLQDLLILGGFIATHAPLGGSPATEAGNPAEPGSGGDACLAVDQRGAPRKAGRCDIGAYEVSGYCVPGTYILCLNEDRFNVVARFPEVYAGTRYARPVRLSRDSAYMTFFDPSNVELTVKVLNGCAVNNHYWVFIAGMTDVFVTVDVTDTLGGGFRTYTNPPGTLFRTVADTAAFPCP